MIRLGMHALMPHHPVAETRQVERGPYQPQTMIVDKIFRGASGNGQEEVGTRRDESRCREIGNPYSDMSAVAEVAEGCQGPGAVSTVPIRRRVFQRPA